MVEQRVRTMEWNERVKWQSRGRDEGWQIKRLVSDSCARVVIKSTITMIDAMNDRCVWLLISILSSVSSCSPFIHFMLFLFILPSPLRSRLFTVTFGAVMPGAATSGCCCCCCVGWTGAIGCWGWGGWTIGWADDDLDDDDAAAGCGWPIIDWRSNTDLNRGGRSRQLCMHAACNCNWLSRSLHWWCELINWNVSTFENAHDAAIINEGWIDIIVRSENDY